MSSWHAGDQMRIWAYFQSAGRDAFLGARPRLDAMTRRVSKRARGRAGDVLTVGAGDGYLEECLAARGLHVSTLDPIADTVDRLVAKGIRGRVGFLEEAPFDDGEFDVVVASEVLEHLTPDQGAKALSEVHRMLRIGGWFVGTVPAREVLEEQTAVCPSCGCTFHRWGHRRRFDRDELRQELGTHFSDVRVTTRAFVPFRHVPPRKQAKSAVRWVLGRAGAAIAVPSLAFEARKTADHGRDTRAGAGRR